jgi:TatD DNase family protein
MYCDAHNHLHDEGLKPHREQVFADLGKAGVSQCVVNGTCEEDWADVADLARASRIVRPSFGLHPWEVGNASGTWKEKLTAMLDRNPTAVIGEIGLDRWILDQAKPDDPRLRGLRRASMEEQTEAFCWQFMLAADRNLVASVHCLNAFGVLHEVLRSASRTPRSFLLHAYSGPAEMVPLFVKFGAHFSFNGAFLDPRKTRIREVYATIPSNRLLVETDAPAMRVPATLERYTLPDAAGNVSPKRLDQGEHGEGTAPPFREPAGAIAGPSVNHPANIVAAYEGLAQIRGVDLKTLAGEVQQNFLRLFR